MSMIAHRPGRHAEWMSIHEAASLVGVSPATLRRWCDAGNVRAFTTPGGHRRFSRRAITGLLPVERDSPTSGQLDRLAAVLVRSVRREAFRIAAEPAWSGALDAADRDELERLSHQMIAGVVATLRDGPARRPRGLSRGSNAAFRSGELVGCRGVELDAMVEASLRLHATVVHEVAEAAGRLGLDAPTTATWIDLAAGCASRFLADAVRGHATARATRRPAGVEVAER